MHIIGSKTSSTKELLNAVNPQYALIGVGKDNKFGHPSEVTIQKLKEMNIKILRTDNMGEIVIKTNGTKISFQPQLYEKNMDDNTNNISYINRNCSGKIDI